MARRQQGRKFETWHIGGKARGNYKVDVRVCVNASNETVFTAEVPDLGFSERSSNPNELRKLVKAGIDKLENFKAEKFYRVVWLHDEIEFAHLHPETECFENEESIGMKLEVEPMTIITLGDGTKKFYSSHNDLSMASYVSKGTPDVGDVDQSFDGSATASLVPATKANREALHRLFEAIYTVKSKIREFLKPDAIGKSLANVSGLLLPAPKKKGGE